MTRPMIKIHNTETDEVIEREMNDEEFSQYEVEQTILANMRKQEEVKTAEKVALLAKLGITEDEAKLLFG